MPTAALNFTRQRLKKIHENDAQEPDGIPRKISPSNAAKYFEISAQATGDAFRDWNVGTGTLAWPEGLETLFGYAPSAETREIAFWWSHVHPDDLERLQKSLRTALEGTADRWQGEYRFQHANGDYVHILERALIARDSGGEAVRLTGPMMDVTARKQLQAQACRSQRMEAFGHLTGGVAHDFNNFLTTIIGYSELILTEKGLKAGIARQIGEIRAAAGRASCLANQLLAFSKSQALQPTALEVNALISNLEGSLLRLLGENISIVCHSHLLKEGAHIKVDAGQLIQIILNLTLNARDAMPQGGRLTIETAIVRLPEKKLSSSLGVDLPAGEYVSISVADTGAGMTDEVKARLFEPFFTTKSTSNNSGLGLATSYGIVRQSGGDIRVESEPGRGTTFHILLPRVAPPATPYRKPGQRKGLTGSETILVLEDEVSVRHLSVRILRKLGYDVIEAAHGGDARRLITRHGKKIDLLLTDMVLPEISGRNFADWLCRTNPGTRVIFISGYLEESLHPRDRVEPGMTFLAKPFTLDQLASKVREVLDADG
jgi:PAS domain S-box-containing protein